MNLGQSFSIGYMVLKETAVFMMILIDSNVFPHQVTIKMFTFVVDSKKNKKNVGSIGFNF